VKINNDYNVPILMYHSIGVPRKDWNWNYLTCPFEKFEEQLKAIKDLGLKTISLSELYDYMVLKKKLSEAVIVITFDDGYADIWSYAYPLLKKYNMCGTVFINPEFVDPREELNPLYCCDGHTAGVPTSGFLSWKEIQKMDVERVVYSESHALTHTWYPVSEEIIDFRHPNDEYKWMTWNAHEGLKHSLQIENFELVKLGQPVYKNEKSLLKRRMYQDESLDAFLVDFVCKNGGHDFFQRENYRVTLYEQVELYRSNNSTQVSFESEINYHERIKHELLTSKVILEEKLDRKITFLCWPGGSATKVGMEIARDLGYNFFNSARDMKIEERNSIKNVLGGGDRVKRFTPIIYFNGKEDFDSKIIFANSMWMKFYFYRYTKKPLSKYWFKVIRLLANFYYKRKFK